MRGTPCATYWSGEMSKFFKAIDQAERDRAVREEARRWGPEATQVKTRVPADRADATLTQTVRASVTVRPIAEDVGDRPTSRRVPGPEAHPEPVGRLDDHLVTL